MEYEVRYYYPKNSYEELITIMEKKNLIKRQKRYEKTIQYNHPMKEYDFYSKALDARFRLRITKSEEFNECKISYKRRLGKNLSGINEEEEREVHIDVKDFEEVIYILEKVLHMKKEESYERYRTVFENDDVEIAIDEYPFGIAVEIESKSIINPLYVINYWINELGLDESRRYDLSWDDKYQELCIKQNKEIYKFVEFGKEMPEVK